MFLLLSRLKTNWKMKLERVKTIKTFHSECGCISNQRFSGHCRVLILPAEVMVFVVQHKHPDVGYDPYCSAVMKTWSHCLFTRHLWYLNPPWNWFNVSISSSSNQGCIKQCNYSSCFTGSLSGCLCLFQMAFIVQEVMISFKLVN